MKPCQPISAIIITQDEEENIRDCLRSVAWADEIIVVDGGSRDRTGEIARAFTEKLYHNPFPGFAAQKRFALEKATKPWVLSIDSDERVTPELQQEITARLAQEEITEHGFYLPRLSTFLGKFIHHSGWYPGYQLRLFRREHVRVLLRPVHEGFEVDGPCAHLQNHLLHYTHKTLSESFARLNHYSSLEATARAGRKTVHWWDFLFHPLAAFFNKFIALRGYRDGMHGFLLAIVTAMVKLALYMKIWELQHVGASERPGAGAPRHFGNSA